MILFGLEIGIIIILGYSIKKLFCNKVDNYTQYNNLLILDNNINNDVEDERPPKYESPPDY